MKRYLRPALVLAAMLAIGAVCSGSYLRAIEPLCARLIDSIAKAEHWQAAVSVDRGVRGTTLRLASIVRHAGKSAVVIATVTAGAVMQIVVTFWGVLLATRCASWRARIATTAAGIPICISLTVIAATGQLLAPSYGALAVLQGRADTATSWDYASDFLEAGGRTALSIAAALIVAAMAASSSAATRSTLMRRTPLGS